MAMLAMLAMLLGLQAESEKEKAREEAEEAASKEEQLAALRGDVADVPVRSVFAIVRCSKEERGRAWARMVHVASCSQWRVVAWRQVNHLTTNFGLRLPKEACQVCKKPVLPNAPAKAAKYLDSDDHKKRPERVYCGHWYHYSCLDKYLTRPPFLKMCPVSEQAMMVVVVVAARVLMRDVVA